MLTVRPRIVILAVLTGTAGGCAWRTAEAPVFCYRWLTDVTCYLEPVPDAEARLVGGYLVDPDDPSTRTYWLEQARARMSR
jgi:hypothetical protein